MLPGFEYLFTINEDIPIYNFLTINDTLAFDYWTHVADNTLKVYEFNPDGIDFITSINYSEYMIMNLKE